MRHDDAGAREPLSILFSMRNYWYVRHFEPVVRALAARGHHVRLVAERPTNERAEDWHEAASALAADVGGLTYETAPRAHEDDWYDLRLILRLGLDYARFMRPEYRALSPLVTRARQRTPRWLRRVVESPIGRSRAGRAALTRTLAAAEACVPPDPALAAFIESARPDLVVVTPLVELGSEQADVVRVARRLGIPAALCVGSWDHLSSKGLIRTVPDRVFVWNETQRWEAIEMHGVPGDRIEVTGAQVFDQWFDRQPTLGREAFCRKVGVDASRPYVLWVCSALFEGSPSEAMFVARWAEALRASGDPVLRDAGILVRPHPKRGVEWRDVDVSRLAGVALWPPQASAPVTAVSKADYFDSLFHSAAVVGLNTSAQIEAGIVGRPVHTILVPELEGNQEGTLHFRYLLDGGLLRSARTFEHHLAQLGASLREPAESQRNRAFVESFVRPRGLDQPATPVLTSALERLAGTGPQPAGVSMRERLVRRALAPLAKATSGRFAEQVGRERRRRAEAAAR
ncbi:MAG: hypothetical protein ACRD26_12030, partial [Vicinamibacterales bacterium]